MKNLSTLSTLVLTTLFFLFSNNSFAQSSLKVNLGSDRKICYGAYTELTANVSGGQAPYTYQWSSSEELSSTNTEQVIATPAYNATYKIIVKDAKGNTSYDEVNVEVNQHPNVSVNSSVSIEQGDVATLSANASGGSGSYTYSWRPTTGLDNPNSNSPKAKPQMAMTYTVMVKDSKGCVATEQVTVNVISSVQASVGKKK